MSNVNIKEAESGEVTTLSDADGVEIDTGTTSVWIQISNLAVAILKRMWDQAAKTTLTGADVIFIIDSAASNAPKKITWTNFMGQVLAFTGSLTNKTFDLASNTLTGTSAQFNIALSDNAFATHTGVETLTNKTLTAPTIADFTNANHDHGDTDDGGPLVSGFLIGAAHFYLQDATPASPAAGDFWLEADTGILWVYGTYAAASRWVSVQRHIAGSASGIIGSAASVTSGFALQVTGYDLYLETFYLRGFVITTNDGTKYWTSDIRKVSGSTNVATGAGSSIVSLNTSTWSPDTWSEISTAIDAILDGAGAGIELMFHDLTKVSTAGNFHHHISVVYRLVHP